MNRIRGVLIACLVTSLAACGGGCSSDSGKAGTAFRREVPSEMASRISKGLEEVRARHNVTAEEKNALSAAIRDLNLKYPSSSDAREDEIRSHPFPAVIAAAELLASADVTARQQGATTLLILACIRSPGAGAMQAGLDPVMIPLFHRSLFADRDPKVRAISVSGITSIGIRSSGGIPAEIKEALEEAASDADPRIRDVVQRARERLGLIPPHKRQPGEPYIDDF